jgi:YggT family protein
MISGLIYLIGGFIEIIIGLRFLFRLLGANPGSAFVDWVYAWSTPFVTPFAGVFGQEATVTPTGLVTTGVFDWAALVALIVIGLIVGLIGRLLLRRPV